MYFRYLSTISFAGYRYVSIDEPVFDKVSTQLNELLNIVSYNCALNVYSAEIHRLHITQMVQDLSHRLPGVDAHSPVALQPELHESQLGPIKEIRAAITILFSFLRRSMPDKVYLAMLYLMSLLIIILFAIDFRWASRRLAADTGRRTFACSHMARSSVSHVPCAALSGRCVRLGHGIHSDSAAPRDGAQTNHVICRSGNESLCGFAADAFAADREPSAIFGQYFRTTRERCREQP